MPKKPANITNLGDLIPDQVNARKHNPRNIGMITDAIQEVGVSRSGVIDEDGNILAGNGTYEALSAAGLRKVKVVEADGEEWVVVRRTGLSKEQKAKLALYDNRTAELAGWDEGNMAILQDEFPDIFEKMFDNDELGRLLDDTGPIHGMPGEDDMPEPPAEPRTYLGDVYQIGAHRLMCGDSTSKSEIDTLMAGKTANMVFTDPPYGVDYVGKTAEAMTIKNDTNPDIFAKVIPHFPIDPGATVYVCCPGGDNFIDFERPFHEYCHHSSTIVWNKSSMVLGHGDYHWKWEPILYGWKLGAPHKFYGDRTQVNVWDIDKPGASRLHPTMKPIELIERALVNSSLQKHIVFDPFGGSGSTLVACEKLGRAGYLMELDPIYCDVIVTRIHELFPELPIFLNDEEIQWQAAEIRDAE